MGELAILGKEGDTKVCWDPENEDEVEAAANQFDALMEKGFKAYKVKKDGEPGREIKHFNRDSGMIIMVPKIVGG